MLSVPGRPGDRDGEVVYAAELILVFVPVVLLYEPMEAQIGVPRLRLMFVKTLSTFILYSL